MNSEHTIKVSDETLAIMKKNYETYLAEKNDVKKFPENLDDIIKIIKSEMKESWDKMGSTGADDYWETATIDEIFEFGRFRGLEDCYDLLIEYKNKLLNEKENKSTT